jgi:hypothetical protein
LLLVILVVFGSFACLFPLAFYCLVVASLNNRRRPTLVSGPADFAGALLATAGFLIVGGPLILSGVHDAWRRTLLRGSFAAIRDYLAQSSGPWLLLWIIYYVGVVGGACWLLWRRRAYSVVYNLDAATANKLVPDALDRHELPWSRRGSTYYVGFTGPTSALPGSADDPVVSERQAVLEVTDAPALRHVTLYWSFDDGVRRQVEGELRQALEGVESPESPAGGWFLAAATVLFMVLLVVLALFMVFVWNLRG